MPKGDASRKSTPTGIWRPCPETVYEHPETRVAYEIQAGPRSYWGECACCGTHVFVARKKLSTTKGRKPKGMTRAQAAEEGFLPL